MYYWRVIYINLEAFLFMIRYISILISLITILFCDDTISGYVYDGLEKPIENVQVSISNSILGTTTDSLGYFSLYVDLKLYNSISFSHIAYNNKTLNITDQFIVVYLEKEVHSTNQVFVNAIGYNTFVKDSPVITQIISSKDIEKSPYSSINDLIEFEIPNVQKVHDPHGNDRVKIQGLDNKFLVFLIDGDRISGEFAGNIDFSLISISDIERIEYTKGGLSSVYGSDAIGGIVNIVTKKNNNPISGSLSVNYDLPNLQTYNAGLGIKYKKLKYKIHADINSSPGYDLTSFSPLSKTVEEYSFYNISNEVKYIYDNGELSFRNKLYERKVNRYNSIFNINTLEYDTVLHQQNPRYYDYKNSINHKHLISKNLSYELNISHEKYNKSFYFPYYYSAYPSLDGETKKGSIPTRTDALLKLKTNISDHFINLGFDFSNETYQSFNIIGSDGVTIEDQSIFSDERKKEVNEYSMFITDKYIYGKIDIVFGNRLTKYSTYSWQSIPFLSLRYPTDKYNFRFNYSKGYRIPGLKEMFYNFLGHNPPIFGNINLKPSMSNHISFSIESRKNKNSYVEIYINDIYDMISTENRVDGMHYVNKDNVTLFGMNSSFNKKINDNVEAEFICSFTDGNSNSEYLLEGISLVSINSKLSWNFYNKLIMIYSMQYNSSKNVIMFDSGLRNELDAYSISNLIIVGNWKNLNFKVGLKNIFDYMDPMRSDENSNEYLNTTDPGRRAYLSLGFKI